jgi:predicted amidohydrolase YtcJ
LRIISRSRTVSGAMRVFSGGPILTMRRESPRAEALAIDGDRIVAVGEAAPVRAAAPGAEAVDLAGACLLPGFIDAHHHFSEGALFNAMTNLHWPAVHSVEDILLAVQARASETPPGQWVIGEGYDESRLRKGRRPTLRELDSASPEHPVLLVQYSYHEAIVNSRAHQVVGLPLRRPDPPGGEIGLDRSGEPTGHMVENAMAPFYTRAIGEALARDEAGYMAQLARYQDRLFAAGLTRVYDAAVSPLMEDVLRRAVELGVLRIPVLMMLAGAEGMFMPPRERLGTARTGEGDDLLRRGPLKMFMDGGERAGMALPLRVVAAAGLAATGRMLRDRSLAPLRTSRQMSGRLDSSDWCVRSGILFYTEAQARELVDQAVAQGLSLAIHAEGNEAIDRALGALPRSPQDRAAGVGPHRIEHFFFPGPDAIGRAAEASLATAVQPTIVEWVGDRLLAMGMVGRWLFTPLRAMLDAGLTVAGSSDAPVVDFDPLVGIRAAVRRRAASGEPVEDGQQVTIGEALEMYTVHGARSGGLEHEVGTLEAGKRADLVVLDADPTTLAPEELDRLAVERTVCGGADVYLRTAGFSEPSQE